MKSIKSVIRHPIVNGRYCSSHYPKLKLDQSNKNKKPFDDYPRIAIYSPLKSLKNIISFLFPSSQQRTYLAHFGSVLASNYIHSHIHVCQTASVVSVDMLVNVVGYVKM